MVNLNDIHKFWKDPNDGNSPESYLIGKEKSEFLVSIIDIPKDSKILELGCNIGRNLDYLSKAGFTDLRGIEISRKAVDFAKVHYPYLKIYCSSIEDIIKDLREFDLVFTMATLEHIHTDSEWIFPEVERIAKRLITIEDERGVSPRHFPRNYKNVFKLKQIKEINLKHIKGLDENFIARVFIK